MLKFLKGIYGVAVACFMVVPLAAILPLAFNDGVLINYPMNGVSLRWFDELLTSAVWKRAIINSLVIGTATALLATSLGTLAALGLRNRSGTFYSICRTAFLLPMVAPVVVLGVGMQIIFSRIGLLNTYTGIIIAHTVVALPFVVISAGTGLAGVSPVTERAAASLGAAPFTVFRRVTLPIAFPGILSGAIFAFATSLDEVILLLFLGSASQRTLAREMFAQLRDNLTPVIAAVAFLFIIGTLLLSVLSVVIRRRRSVAIMPE